MAFSIVCKPSITRVINSAAQPAGRAVPRPVDRRSCAVSLGADLRAERLGVDSHESFRVLDRLQPAVTFIFQEGGKTGLPAQKQPSGRCQAAAIDDAASGRL